MSNDYDLKDFITFANILANESEKIIMEYFRKSFNTELKNDNTPVTIVDKKSEEKIRLLLNEKYPNHGIIGEEYDKVNLNSEFIWVIDPIDGTNSFIAGHKDFGTLIALLHNKEPIVLLIKKDGLVL